MPTTQGSARLNLLVKVARLYHVSGLRQVEIASQLNVSQSRVSRMLTEAQRRGIVRTTVVTPEGSQAEVEEALVSTFGLLDAVVVEPDADDEASVLRALGTAGAVYLETTLTGNERLGLSSWSATLLAVVDSMTATAGSRAEEVTQLLGGVGDPAAQVRATHLADHLAALTKARVHYLPLPGLVSAALTRDALLSDASIADVVASWTRLTHALVGIGGVQPSELLQSSGNALSADHLAMLDAQGAVGDVCLRFFDADGDPVVTELDERIVGIGREELRRVPRVIGVAGTARKHAAVLGAVHGRWVDVLITDLSTARYLLEAGESSEPGQGRPAPDEITT